MEEINQLSNEEITARIKEEKMNLTRFRFTQAVSTLENPNKIVQTRKTIARLFTELSKRKLTLQSEKI